MKKNWNNKGVTLIEILVVVAIMSIAVGGAGIGISLAYSRDAEKCAKTINAALENTRMMSMSEKGNFTMELDMENNMLYIRSSEESDPVYEEDLQSRVTITVPADLSATSVTVQFDKSTGKVLSMSSESNGILRITSENNNGKKATVVLVKGTGKHYVEYK
ncbi:MAG: type II secretion system protein [Suilimivivens sp.]